MIKIGVLLDSFNVKRWHNEIIKYIIEHQGLELCVFIVNTNEPKFISKGSFIYRLSQAIDRKVFSISNDVFKEIDLSRFSEDFLVYNINGVEKRFSYRFPSEEIEKIKDLKLDLLIRFGFGILKGEILNAARYGVWSLHHGDNRINRGGPPAFWEIINKEEITGITLQKLSEDLDGGKVINRSFIKTDATSFYRNKNQAFWAGVELFNISLDRLAKNELDFENLSNTHFLGMYGYPLYKDPDNWTSLEIMFKFWRRRISELINEKFIFPQWFILYKYNSTRNIEKSIFRYKTLYPPRGFDWADPFVIKKENIFYVFFEELEISKKKAHISYLKFGETGDLIDDKPVKVLEEPYHLSYPFIFENNDQYYLMPESADLGELWLYKAVEFPFKWNKAYKLLNREIYDATLFFHGGSWYLFGTEKYSVGGSRDQYLHIYYSDHLSNKNWTPHPQNPITIDVRGARPAGKIFKENNKIYRPAQVGAPKYGYGMFFFEILELSKTEYKEVFVSEIIPMWKNEILATHTFNTFEGFTAIDAQGKI